MTMNIKLAISYDGTDFSGWQRQEGRRTAQGEIENALSKMHKKHIPLTGAGRTDSGVHARRQCANFYTDIKNIAPANFVPALNGALPRDIRVMSAEEAPWDFNARFSATRRVYRYYINCGTLPAGENRYALELRHTPDINLLNSYTRLLRGETDCSIFAMPSDQIFSGGTGSRGRFIYNCVFFIEGGRLVFEISANAFFRKMVRSIIGTFLFYERRGADADELGKIIARGKREDAGPTAEARGLFLHDVRYDGRRLAGAPAKEAP